MPIRVLAILAALALALPAGAGTIGYNLSHTVGPGDCGNTLMLGGNAYNSITLPDPSVVGDGCRLVVKNADSGRGKQQVNFPADLRLRLWPLQSEAVETYGGAWVSSREAGKWTISGNLVVYVDLAGNDTNDGLAAGLGAFLTTQAALDTVCDDVRSRQALTITVQHGAGTFTLPNSVYTCDVEGAPAGGYLTHSLEIAGASASNLYDTTFSCGAVVCFVALNTHSGWRLDNLALTGTAGGALADSNGSVLYVGNIINIAGAEGLLANANGFLELVAETVYGIGGGKHAELAASNGGLIICRAPEWAFAAAGASEDGGFAIANFGGHVLCPDQNFSGIASTGGEKYSATYGGGIWGGTNSPDTYWPGATTTGIVNTAGWAY